MLKRVWALVIATLAWLFTVVMATISLIASLVDKEGKVLVASERIWARFILKITRVDVIVKGTENIDLNQTYIFAGNHQSYFDIWSLLAFFPARFRFIAKESLFRWPFLGWHLRRAGHIPIDRDNLRKSIKVLQSHAADKIKTGVSIFIFPEGTRSSNGTIGAFRKGSMLLANKTSVPIVPVAISGSRHCLPKGSFVTSPGTVEIVICSPIDTREYSVKNLSQLADRVREKIVENYKQFTVDGG